jgi:putative ABC transport system permease protein
MPDWAPEIRARLAAVRLSPTREAEVIEELSQHLEDRWRELVAQGVAPDEAAHIARTSFQGSDVLARYMTTLRQANWSDPAPPGAARALSLEGLGADLRQAVRGLRATPSVTIAALAVLTLGIGATTAIFSVVDAVVLRALPFERPASIVAVGERSRGPRRPGPGPVNTDPEALDPVQPQNYLDWIEKQQVFESIAAIANTDATLTAPGTEPEAVALQRVTASFFEVLRVRPARGDRFRSDQEVEGRDRVAILSDAFWRRRFNAREDVLGQTVSIDGDLYAIAGVMPPSFTFPVGASKPTELWVPYVVPANERIRGRGHALYLQSIARLKDGVTLEQARQHMSDVAAGIERANPEWNRGSGAGVRPLRDHLVGASMRSWMLMLLTAVAGVLIIACANVANLLLARAAARQRDAAVRAALGAGRWRLIRQSLVEGLTLSSCGTALAVAGAWLAVRVLRGTMPEDVPRVAAIGLNWRVLAAAAMLALFTGLVCGLLPALRSSKPDLIEALGQNSRAGGAGRARLRIRHALVVGELALALVLVVGSALFVASFIRVMRIDPGFDKAGVMSAQIFQRSTPGKPPMDLTAPLLDVVEKLRQTPNVQFAAAASPGIPMRLNSWFTSFTVPGVPREVDRGVSIKMVTADYHKTLGIPLRQGRLFTADDRPSPGVAIINEAAAAQYFGSSDPIGRTAKADRYDCTIVGVVANARQRAFEAAALPEVYLLLGTGTTTSAYLAVRTSGDPLAALPAIKTAVAAALPTMALRNISSMDHLVSAQTAERRLTMMMLGLFGLLGLAIAAVGVHGAMAYLVAQRRREIGVRLALGATRASVIRMIFARAAVLVASGVVLGGAASWYLTGAAKSFVFGYQSNDMTGLIAAAVVLSASAFTACALPAWRAATVDPIAALRSE